MTNISCINGHIFRHRMDFAFRALDYLHSALSRWFVVRLRHMGIPAFRSTQLL